FRPLPAFSGGGPSFCMPTVAVEFLGLGATLTFSAIFAGLLLATGLIHHCWKSPPATRFGDFD
ncbi:MAG: hypothetical protein OXH76_07545, partial [Boseongicola sp.]|nr:hypothetical protein [Boseongicola sp.]